MNTKYRLFLISLAVMAMCLTSQVTASAQEQFSISEGLDNGQLKSTLEHNVNTFIAALTDAAERQQKKVKLNEDLFTAQAIDDVKAMWRNSPMSCPPVRIRSRCLNTSQGYQVRGIPIDILNADEQNARQELTIDFTPDGRISNVSIAIEMHRYDKIMADNKSALDYARRQKVVEFIENFRTAYNRKDLPYISSVYSENALIITGRVIKERPSSLDGKLITMGNKVVYTQQNKAEYIAKLKNIFKRNSYVNVRFEDIDVVESRKYDNVYGVTLKQYWHTAPTAKSKGYSDVGYLFLIIDFTNSDDPLIQVRTWQPYLDDQGNIVTTPDEVYHLGMFKLPGDSTKRQQP
ncbi:MAG: hypothetical protein IKR25_07970 [Muribaculaceae bacterium]|nr:hypothetical protein [Muribaculaceae bacterium]